jgi:PAS domain S-box-containing protein
MGNEERTRRRLEEEVRALRERVAELEATQAALSEAEQSLRESEARLKLAVEGSGGGVWDVRFRHGDGVAALADRVYLSARVKEFIGYDGEDFAECIEARDARMLPEDLPKVQKAERDHFEGRTDLHQVEYRLRRDDGGIRWILGRSRILRDSEGRPLRWMGIDWDVTSQREAEQALRESEERLKLAVEGSDGGLWDMTFHQEGGKYFTDDEIYLSPRLKSFLGYEEDEMPDSLAFWDSHLLPEDLPRLRRAGRAHIERETDSHEVEYRVRRKGGSIRWILSRGKILRDEQGRPIRWTGIDWDVTERKEAEEALRVSEERLKLAVEGLGGGLWDVPFVEVDGECELGNYVYLSPRPMELVGYRGEDLRELVEARDKRMPPEDLRRLRRSGGDQLKGLTTNQEVEYRLRQDDGSYRWICTRSKIVRGADGRPVRWTGIDWDVTERKEAEEQLRASEARYRHLFEELEDAAFVADAESGVIVDANRQAEALLGRPRSEIIGLHQSQLHPPEQADEYRRRFADHVERGHAADNEGHVVRKDGAVVPIAISASVIEVGGRRLALGLFRDLSERREAEKALQESEERYRALMEKLNVGVYRTTGEGEGRFIHANEALARIHGYDSVEELMSVPVVDLYKAPEERRRLLEHLREHGYVRNLEARTRKKDGSPMWTSLSARAQYDEQGRLKWLDGISEEITERKLAEQKLMAYQKQLQSLASELSLAEERERQKLAADLHDRVGQLLGLAVMRLGVLQEQVESPALADGLQEVEGQVTEALEAARSVTFDLSPPVLHELGLVPAVRWLADQTEREHGLRVRVSGRRRQELLPEEVRSFMFRAARELLLNAVKHARASEVGISIKGSGRELRVRVRDDGVGFDPAAAEEGREATGAFGLFSLRERLQQLGGKLEVKSARGRGTAVTLTVGLDGLAGRTETEAAKR